VEKLTSGMLPVGQIVSMASCRSSASMGSPHTAS
jgi:hypothetical protein